MFASTALFHFSQNEYFGICFPFYKEELVPLKADCDCNCNMGAGKADAEFAYTCSCCDAR